MSLLTDFTALFYPLTCAACSGELVKGEEFICTNCVVSLPYTGFESQSPNLVEQIFWGRVPVEAATAYLHFRKGNKTRNMMHRIKYKGEKELAAYVGKLMARGLMANPAFAAAEMIIPVPMHKNKQRKRGFNQSEWFAKGLAERMGVPVVTDVLIKTTATKTQTQKSRWQRWISQDEVVKVVNAETITGKHILLVDDIVTTGSTLEHCANALKAAAECKISIATMAFAG